MTYTWYDADANTTLLLSGFCPSNGSSHPGFAKNSATCDVLSVRTKNHVRISPFGNTTRTASSSGAGGWADTIPGPPFAYVLFSEINTFETGELCTPAPTFDQIVFPMTAPLPSMLTPTA